MDHDHHHPQNPNLCGTHFSDNFDALPEFELSDFLLLDDGSEEGFSPENMASSDNVIDGSIESVGASSSTHSNMHVIKSFSAEYIHMIYFYISLLRDDIGNALMFIEGTRTTQKKN